MIIGGKYNLRKIENLIITNLAITTKSSNLSKKIV